MNKEILVKAREKTFQASRELEENQMGGGREQLMSKGFHASRKPAELERVGGNEQQMSKGLPGHLRYKNKLQEFTQKSGINFPDYQTINEGFQHAPKFKCTVIVNGIGYGSGKVFSHKKDAEQDAAKTALECIEETVTGEECVTIQKDSKLFKSILYEFAVKTERDFPKYNTIQTDLMHPIFASTLTFDGKTYTSGAAKSMKDAEQLAASIAIESLLASGSEILRKIISSKNKDSAIKKMELQVNERPGSSVQPNASLPPFPSTPTKDPRANHDRFSHPQKQKRDEDENWAAKKPRGC